MKIHILTENCAGGHFLAEHGLSYLVEIDDQKILFDTGHSDVQNEQTLKTIEYFKTNQIEQVFPSHCTELPALAAFYDAFQNRQIKTGMVLEF
ncbi:MAG: hypothetical protein K0B11_16605 [Mariniphaga sp.]|nr:hypothetical protein [Mariniphaga sp.]